MSLTCVYRYPIRLYVPHATVTFDKFRETVTFNPIDSRPLFIERAEWRHQKPSSLSHPALSQQLLPEIKVEESEQKENGEKKLEHVKLRRWSCFKTGFMSLFLGFFSTTNILA